MSSTVTFTSVTSRPVIRSTREDTLSRTALATSTMGTPYSTTTSRSMAAWRSPTSTPTPCVTPRAGPDPGSLSRMAPSARAAPEPMAWMPAISRVAMPAIFETTESAMLVLPRSESSGLLPPPEVVAGVVVVSAIVGCSSFGRWRAAPCPAVRGGQTRRELEAEQRVEAEGDARAVGHALHRQQHAGHERAPVGGVVAEAQRLPGGAEQHLLVGHEASQAHRVDGDAGRPAAAASPLEHRVGGRILRPLARRGGDAVGGGHGRPRRRVDLGVVVELD